MCVTSPRLLKQRYQEGRLLPFVGAGVSYSVQWGVGETAKRGPSWAELVDEATRILGFEAPEIARVRGTDLQILEYFKLKHSNETATLTNWFARLMDPPEEALMSSGVLRALSELALCETIYTTNYDEFIEKAFRLRGLKVRTVAVESQMASHESGVEIVKFHGDINHPEKIVLTESDYERRLRLRDPLDSLLRAHLLGRVVLFVGYSFRDPNVSYLFRLFHDSLSGDRGALPGPRAYIAIPDPSDFEYTLFGDRNIEVIPLRSGSVGDDLVSLLEDIRS